VPYNINCFDTAVVEIAHQELITVCVLIIILPFVIIEVFLPDLAKCVLGVCLCIEPWVIRGPEFISLSEA
jgi:hypothetical protein